MLREFLDRVLDVGHKMQGPSLVRGSHEPPWEYGIYTPADGKIDWRTAKETPQTRTFNRLDSLLEWADDSTNVPLFVGEHAVTRYGDHVIEAIMPLSQTEEYELLRGLKQPRVHSRFIRALHQVSALASDASKVQAFTKVKLTRNEAGEHEHKIASGQSVAKSLVAEVRGEGALPESLEFTFPVFHQLVGLPDGGMPLNDHLNNHSVDLHLHVDAQDGTLWLRPLAGVWDGLERGVLNNVIAYINRQKPDMKVLRGQASYTCTTDFAGRC